MLLKVIWKDNIINVSLQNLAIKRNLKSLKALLNWFFTWNENISIESEAIVDKRSREPNIHLHQCLLQHVRGLEKVEGRGLGVLP